MLCTHFVLDALLKTLMDGGAKVPLLARLYQ